MTANRFAASVFAPLLAGGLLFLAAGCGFDGEDDEWVVEGDRIEQKGGGPTQPSQSAQPSQSSQSTSSSSTRTQPAAQNPSNAGSGTPSQSGSGGNGKPAAETAGTGTDIPVATAPDPAAPAAGGVDTIPFSSLKWSFGHFGGSRAKLSSPQLANLKCSGNTLSYKWVQGLGGWGLSNGEAGAIAAAFVQKADGSWVGGKFDWVSTSRSSRGLENVLAGYEGWNLAGVPNPCQICFVVVDVSGRRRSNVVGPATWSR